MLSVIHWILRLASRALSKFVRAAARVVSDACSVRSPRLHSAIVVTFVSFAMIVASPGGHPFIYALAQGQPLEGEIEDIDVLTSLLADLREEIDTTAFDVDELSLLLAFEDPEYIVEWVAQNIAFQQYQGLLRGPSGTLMSRSGNSLDQAVLLARLLRDAGYDARVARGQLSVEDATSLVQSLARPVPEPPAVFRDAEAAEAIISRISQLGGEDLSPSNVENAEAQSEPSASALELLSSTRETGQFLSGILEPSFVGLGDGAGLDQIVHEARDYFWVEYRASIDDAWSDAHPVLPLETSIGELEVDERFDASVPSDLLHKVRLEIVVDRRLGSEVQSEAVASPWEAPTANIVGRPLTFSNVPESLLGEQAPTEIIEVLDSATMFFPALDGDLAPGASAFNLEGSVAPVDAAMNQAAGVFENVGSAFGSAAGALGGSDNTPMLLGQRLVITFVQPGGVERTVERTVASRGEDGASDDEWELRAFKQALMSQYTFMIAVGDFQPGFVLKENIQAYESFMTSLAEDLRNQPGPTEGAMVELGSHWRGHKQLFEAFEAGASRLADVTYRHEPGLVFHRITFDAQNNQVGQSIDIAASPRRAFRAEGDSVSYSPEMAMRAGVWETWAEVSAVGDAGAQISAAEYLRSAELSNRRFVTIASGDDERLSSLDLEPGVKRNIRRDVELGFVVAIPEDASSEVESYVAWWRIDPATGETTGVLGDGTGGAVQDYSLYLILIGLVSFAILVYTMVQCDTEYIGQPAAWSVCFACAWLSALIAVFAFGVALFKMSIGWGLGALLADKVQIFGCLVLADLFSE